MRLQIEVGDELFRFANKAEWMAFAKRWFQDAGAHAWDTVCIDQRGRICMRGEQFERAHKEGTYPVIVFAIGERTAP
jgi:hypothetical protein